MERIIAPAFGFTPEQQKQYDRLVPDVPEEAVAQILREWSCPGEEEDLLQEAYLGTRNGVLSFEEEKVGEALEEEEKEKALRQWVFFSALHAAQAVRRKVRRERNRVVAHMWDGTVEFCKRARHTVGVMDTREEDRAALTEFRNRAAAAPFVRVATLEIPAGGGDDEMVARLTAARCEQGLAMALGDLSGRRHETLRLKFADEQPVKETAAARGEKGYRAELNEFNSTVALLAARLYGMGFHERPPFPREAGGTILRESTDTPPAPPAPRTEP